MQVSSSERASTCHGIDPRTGSGREESECMSAARFRNNVIRPAERRAIPASYLRALRRSTRTTKSGLRDQAPVVIRGIHVVHGPRVVHRHFEDGGGVAFQELLQTDREVEALDLGQEIGSDGERVAPFALMDR